MLNKTPDGARMAVVTTSEACFQAPSFFFDSSQTPTPPSRQVFAHRWLVTARVADNWAHVSSESY